MRRKIGTIYIHGGSDNLNQGKQFSWCVCFVNDFLIPVPSSTDSCSQVSKPEDVMKSFCWALLVHPCTGSIRETNRFRVLDAPVDEVSRDWQGSGKISYLQRLMLFDVARDTRTDIHEHRDECCVRA